MGLTGKYRIYDSQEFRTWKWGVNGKMQNLGLRNAGINEEIQNKSQLCFTGQAKLGLDRKMQDLGLGSVGLNGKMQNLGLGNNGLMGKYSVKPSCALLSKQSWALGKCRI